MTLYLTGLFASSAADYAATLLHDADVDSDVDDAGGARFRVRGSGDSVAVLAAIRDAFGDGVSVTRAEHPVPVAAPDAAPAAVAALTAASPDAASLEVEPAEAAPDSSAPSDWVPFAARFSGLAPLDLTDVVGAFIQACVGTVEFSEPPLHWDGASRVLSGRTVNMAHLLSSAALVSESTGAAVTVS